MLPELSFKLAKNSRGQQQAHSMYGPFNTTRKGKKKRLSPQGARNSNFMPMNCHEDDRKRFIDERMEMINIIQMGVSKKDLLMEGTDNQNFKSSSSGSSPHQNSGNRPPSNSYSENLRKQAVYNNKK